MPRRPDSNPVAGLDKLVTSLPAAEYLMDFTVLYEDSPSRKWAGQVFQQVESLLGLNAVRATWWKLEDLEQPGVLAGAVSKAIRSDMIVVAVRGSEGMPLPFYYWINAWLPHRNQGSGALVTLLGSAIPRNSHSGRLRRYLRTVARRARMDLLVAECPADARPSRLGLRIEPHE